LASKGQYKRLGSFVNVPDSVCKLIEQNYRYKNTNACENVVNLLFPNKYEWGNGIYVYKGNGPHYPRYIFINKENQLFFFKSSGYDNPKGVVLEFAQCVESLKLTNDETIKYFGMVYRYLIDEKGSDYGGTIK
jgi:hypothetical protein